MFTIVMNQDKTLSKKNVTTIYQREKLIDKIRFLIPLWYGCKNEGVDLSGFTVVLKYVDQGNVSHMETLVPSDETYKDAMRCFYLPVDTNLTKFAGDIELRVTLSKVDTENQKHYVLHSSSTVITVEPLEDYYRFVTDESLEFVDRLMGKVAVVEQQIDFLNKTKADNLRKTDNELQLESNGELIGDSVTVECSGDSEIGEDGLPTIDFGGFKDDVPNNPTEDGKGEYPVVRF